VLKTVAALLCLIIATPAFAWLHGGGGNGVLSFPLSYYATFANGPPSTGAYFPVLIWDEDPAQTTGVPAGKANIAAAAQAIGVNTFLGIENWPSGFGVDGGEMAAVKAATMYLIGGKTIDYASGTTATSVPSILALLTATGAQANFIGYNINDESACGTGAYQTGDIGNEVSDIQAYDATRLTAFNQVDWPVWDAVVPYGCSGVTHAQATAAIGSLGFGSFDMYPVTNPDIQWQYCAGSAYVQTSDSLSTPNDCIWTNGVGVQALRAFNPTKPAWVYVESGSDILGGAFRGNNFHADVANGSNVIVNQTAYYQQNISATAPVSTFTATWQGLTLSGTCIPANTTITGIVDSTHATMSANATCAGSLEAVTVTGGVFSSDCVASANLCVAAGNRYRATPVEVNAEAWVTLISGAYGIEWFCHDTVSYTFCLGDPAGGSAATAVAANLTYIDGVIGTYSHQLNAAQVGICSMQNTDRSTAASCTNGVLTMATSDASVPGLARAHSYGGSTYLFAMSDRRSTTGASMTFTVAGAAAKTATVVYDSDSQYDSAHNNLGATFTLNGSAQFSDTFGANSDHYQVRIYAIH